MRVNLKALGLALVAALAMSAVVASAAQAAQAKFTAVGNVEAVAKGSQEAEVPNYFEGTPTGEKIECTTATYQATLKESSPTITVTPHYSGCAKSNPSGGSPTAVSIALNGCHYVFHTVGTTTAGETTHLTADVVCPPEVTGISISGPFGICVDHIEPQTGLTGVTATNKTGKVTVDVNIQNQIDYDHTDTAFCPWTATETRTDGDFVSSVLLTGYKHKGGLEAGPTGANTTYKAGTEVGIHVK